MVKKVKKKVARSLSSSMRSLYIGLDNGVSSQGVGLIYSDGRVLYPKVPTIFQQDYTKAKKNVTRIDGPKLLHLLGKTLENLSPQEAIATVERPMVNPKRFGATASALRCHEATLIVLESLGIPYQFIDSKEWQREMLPKGLKGPDLLKKASYDIGKRLFPQLVDKQKDADSLLIAEYVRRREQYR